MQATFTTNDGEITRLEGLYIKERTPPAVIKGAFFGVVGVAGECVRGPVDQRVTITSVSNFEAIFGARDYGSGGATIIGKIWKALLNKPFGRLEVVRTAADDAVAATVNIAGLEPAVGSIVAATKANLIDGEIFTLNDGVNTPVVFEFDVAGNGVTPGRTAVNVSADTTAAEVAARMRTAINLVIAAELLDMIVTVEGGSTVNLTNGTGGAAGNQAITDTVAHVSFVVTGMAGGSATDILQVDAANVGRWGNDLEVSVEDATNGDEDYFDLIVEYLGRVKRYKNISVFGADVDNTATKLGTSNANLITITKLASGRPTNIADAALTQGDEGAIADADFTAAGRGLNILASAPNVGVVFIAERSTATLRSYLKTLAAAATDRVFLCCADDDEIDIATANTAVALTRSDRLWFTYNHPYTLDPETATEVITDPTSWLASILSQIDVDIHPGDSDTAKFTAGITRLSQPALNREDYILLKEAGICALENDDGAFVFVSGVTTSLDPGKEQMTRRRMADFILISPVKVLKKYVKKKNTITRRAAILGALRSFLGDLKKSERVVERFELDGEVLNTDDQRAEGVEKVLERVKLIGHILHLVIEAEIGTTVTIKEAA